MGNVVRFAPIIRVWLVALILGGTTEPLAGQTAPGSLNTEFVIRAGDLLRIRVWPDSMLGGDFTVEGTGVVQLPVLGAVVAAGADLSVFRSTLRELYGEAMRMPVITVTPMFKVSVLGGVRRPGLYQVDPTQTIFDAISVAGGLLPNAKGHQTRIIRGDQVIRMNIDEAFEGGSSLAQLNLQSSDRIIVPVGREWRISDVFMALQSVLLVFALLDRR